MAPKQVWLFDEAANAGPEHLDPEYVRGYDRKAGFDPSIDVASLGHHGLGADSTVIDLGCGTGEFAIAAALAGARVIAVDVSEPMLREVGAKVVESSLSNVDIVHAGFLTYRHSGPKAEFVYTRNALHHLPDFWKAMALDRMGNFLRPGGVLLLRDLVYSFEPRDADSVMNVWFERASTSSDVGWTRDELETHVRIEYSTFSWLLEPMLTRSGFTVEDVQYSDSRTYATYICVKT